MCESRHGEPISEDFTLQPLLGRFSTDAAARQVYTQREAYHHHEQASVGESHILSASSAHYSVVTRRPDVG
jgi:hypothetical protein